MTHQKQSEAILYVLPELVSRMKGLGFQPSRDEDGNEEQLLVQEALSWFEDNRGYQIEFELLSYGKFRFRYKHADDVVFMDSPICRYPNLDFAVSEAVELLINLEEIRVAAQDDELDADDDDIARAEQEWDDVWDRTFGKREAEVKAMQQSIDADSDVDQTYEKMSKAAKFMRLPDDEEEDISWEEMERGIKDAEDAFYGNKRAMMY